MIRTRPNRRPGLGDPPSAGPAGAVSGSRRWPGWRLSSGPVRAVVGEKVMEVAISLATLGLELGQEIDALAILSKSGQPVAALPGRRAACLELRRF